MLLPPRLPLLPLLPLQCPLQSEQLPLRLLAVHPLRCCPLH